MYQLLGLEHLSKPRLDRGYSAGDLTSVAAVTPTLPA